MKQRTAPAIWSSYHGAVLLYYKKSAAETGSGSCSFEIEIHFYCEGFSMKSKPFKFVIKHIFPVMLAALLISFTSLCGYMEAYATDLPISGGWSGYDIIYTLLNSIGITISVQPDSDGTPPGYTAESYDSFMAQLESNINAAQNNIDAGDTPVQQLVDELKALPSSIKDGCISVSQELWEFLNSYVYQDIASSLAYDDLVDKYAPVNESYPYRYANQVNQNGWISYYGCATTIPVRQCYYDVFSSDGIYEDFCSGIFYASEPFKLYVNDDRIYRSVACGNYYYCTWGLSGSMADGASAFGKVSIAGGVRLTNFEYGWTFGDYISKILVVGGDAVVDVPDVIWPQTDLAYDIVNHVTTWDEAIANDVITTAEDDDTVAVIPLTDTEVGEDVYVDAGDIVIPGSSEAESEASSEATSEAESEKADELVDESVISTLPDKAAAAGDITKLFPFCIPFDIVSMVKGMKAAKKAPVWTFKYYFKDIDYTFEFTVDMTDYDKYIQIFRAGIVIFYVITLMLLTIRYSSGIVKD